MFLSRTLLFLGHLSVARGLCILSETPVTACGSGDLTSANWNKFNIDGFLKSIISAYGTADNFPRFIIQQLSVPSSPINDFDCSSLTNLNSCSIPSGISNPDAASDCAFNGLGGTICASFSSPEAGFIAQNYLNLFQGLVNHRIAVQQAADAITKANFINVMVQALAPKKQSIAPAVFKLIAGLVTDILPIGGEIKAAATFMKKIRLIIKGTKSTLKDDGNDIQSIEESNADIDKEVSATEQQLTQQLANMVTGTQTRLQNIADQIFGPNQDSQTLDPDQIEGSFAFQNAQHGVFLDDVPSVSDLTSQMQTQLQNWIVSSVLEAMNYDVTVDSTPLFDPPGQPGTVCKAENGFPVTQGCALFRIGAIGTKGDIINNARTGNNIFAMQKVAGINIEDIIANAQACNNGAGGGTTDFEGFLEMDNSDSLPSCMFNFPVVVAAL